jgi:hypothetical protein
VRPTDLSYFGREVRVQRLPGFLIMTAIGGTRNRLLRKPKHPIVGAPAAGVAP